MFTSTDVGAIARMRGFAEGYLGCCGHRIASARRAYHLLKSIEGLVEGEDVDARFAEKAKLPGRDVLIH
jgi:hypothetical protein